ncbi:hypothetical protein L21SP5_01472 [Salinivirga cyanobacteriivorans]|uniref:Uncharacterized protein n=1 Tax=Salinivirga cyanobacteriivorans TaxID=1307839 RepID=A0A0S2HYT1_9BACT|nr:hypothetical protein L21SP5_01472 [Salinivirga cyanobacteriivorans]
MNRAMIRRLAEHSSTEHVKVYEHDYSKTENLV